MKKRIFFILILVLFLSFFTQNALADERCFSNGYTLLTINGIFTNETGAKRNSDSLKYYFGDSFNNQSLTVDFLYNPTHLAGLNDAIDAVQQGVFDQKSDYDLVEILNDASQKINTQKLLLVGHSQGNFYANNFYEKVASKPGGVPTQSIGVYGVGTPASYVAGGGKYLTSDTDNVIATVVGRFINILKPNIHIPLQLIDGNGHSFSNVYLKYQGNKIISDIKSSLDKLQNNDEQLSQDPCISPQELSVLHKIVKVVYSVADPVAEGTKIGLNNVYKGGVYVAGGVYNIGGNIGSAIRNTTLAINNIFRNLSANVVESLGDTSSLTTLPLDLIEPENPPVEDTLPIVENTEPAEAIPLQTPQAEELPPPTPPITTVPLLETIPKPEEIITSTEEAIPPPAPDPSSTVDGENPYPNLLPGGGGRVVPPLPPDTIAPTITILGDNPINVIKNTIYTDAGATATDNIDETINIVTTGVSDVNTSVVGTYTITYTARDIANNISTATRTVNIVEAPPIPDTVAPVISILGNSIEIILRNSVYTDAGATAIDERDGSINVVSNGIAEINTTILNTYTITYTATDIANNISTATRTVIVSDGAELNHPRSVFVSGNYAYVVSENSNSFEIIDISNPASLVHKGSLVYDMTEEMLFSPKAVAVSGNYAYVVSNNNALEIIDISNPYLPVHKSALLNGDNGAQLLGPNSIVISSNYAYIVSGGSQNIEIVDISDPAHPTHLTSYYINNTYPSSIFISGNYAYITFINYGASSGFLRILDISNPTSPLAVGTIYDTTDGASISNPQSIYVSNNYAYIVSRGGNALEIVDVSNPGSPIHKGLIRNGDGGASLFTPVSVSISGNYAYVVSLNGNALEVIDISNPATPIHKTTLLNNITGASIYNPSNIFISVNYAYITSLQGNALEVVNISNPLSLIHAGKILNGELVHNTTSTIFNSEKRFLNFDFTDLSPNVIGAVDENNHTISLSVPFGTNITALAPSFTFSTGASSVPTLGETKDFTNPINYLVYAEDGSTQNYVVTVNILPAPPDNTPPSVTSYTFNGAANDITINPVANPVTLVLNASENVNWMSIKIEKENDTSVYKNFQSGINCVDGTNICTKIWDGVLTRGGLLESQTGVYKIKVHIKDTALNEFYDYVLPYKINVVFP